MKPRVCTCPAFNWPHAMFLSDACKNWRPVPLDVPRNLERDRHDFRDTGAPLEKHYPGPDSRNWRDRPDYDR